MTFISISDASSRANYENVAAHVDLAANPPHGLVLHTAGELQSGRVRIVDIWESEQAMQRFSHERLRPALEAAGIDYRPDTGEREVLASFECITPR